MSKLFNFDSSKFAGSGSRLKVTILNSSDSIDLFLHGIVGDSADYCDAKSLSEILVKNPEKPINLRINSPGGSFFDGLALGNAIRRHDGRSTATVDGLCASAATIVAVACDEVYMHRNSTFHVHEAIVGAVGHLADLKDACGWLEECNKHLVDIYADKTGKSAKDIKTALLGPAGDGTHYSATEAFAFGFCDEIIQADGFSRTKRKSSAQATVLPAAFKRLAAAEHRIAQLKISARASG